LFELVENYFLFFIVRPCGELLLVGIIISSRHSSLDNNNDLISTSWVNFHSDRVLRSRDSAKQEKSSAYCFIIFVLIYREICDDRHIFHDKYLITSIDTHKCYLISKLSPICYGRSFLAIVVDSSRHSSSNNNSDLISTSWVNYHRDRVLRSRNSVKEEKSSAYFSLQ